MDLIGMFGMFPFLIIPHPSFPYPSQVSLVAGRGGHGAGLRARHH